jgi:flagellar biosynthesis protein FlhB
MGRMQYKELYRDDGTFDLDKMIKSDNVHLFFEAIVVILFILFFTFGGFNLWLLGGAIKRWAVENVEEAVNLQEMMGQLIDVFYEYDWQSIIILISVYLISLEVSYLIVKWFGKLAA